MADAKSYLSYEGLKTLVAQIKSLVKDASTADASALKEHADNSTVHITAEERTKWNAAATTAAGTVSKTDYDTKMTEIDGSISDLKSEDSSISKALSLTDSSLAKHIADKTVHITSDERTKWNGYEATITNLTNKDASLDASLKLTDASLKLTDGSLSTHVDNADIHVGTGEKAKWNEWHEASANYYKKAETYSQSEVDDKISALGSVFSFKGTVASTDALPKTGNKIGDVYHVTANSGEYVWNGTAWEELGSTIDLSAYATKAELKDVSTKVTTLETNFNALNDVSTSFAKAADLTKLTTRVTTVEGDVSTLKNAGYATEAYVDAKFTAEDGTFAGTAAKATSADNATQLGGVAADKYALKSELEEQMVTPIDTADVEALFKAS